MCVAHGRAVIVLEAHHDGGLVLDALTANEAVAFGVVPVGARARQHLRLHPRGRQHLAHFVADDQRRRLGIGEAGEVRIARDQVVGVDRPGERDEVVVLGIGCDTR